jgi:hypothetical protein
MKSRPWLPIALLGAVLAVGGVSRLFSTFMMYDDEGYVLFSLHEFVSVGGLYKRVYSQYGPFFFLFNQGLHTLGLPFDNIGGRVLTFLCWAAAAGFGTATVWRATRSTAATAFTLGGIFIHLWPMVSEPSHPGGLITLTVAAVAWFASRWVDQPRRLALVTAVAGAALILTKINVGIFLFAAAAAWWGLHLDESRIGPRWRALLVGSGMVLLPCGLMRAQMDQAWVRTFALLATMGGVATVLAVARGRSAITRWSDAGVAIIAALITGSLIALGILVQGTSPAGLLEGVLLGPLRHPQAYSAAINWRPGALAFAWIGLALAAWFVLRPPARAPLIVAVGRLIATLLFFTAWSLDWPFNSHAFALSYGLAAIWLFVYPLEGESAHQPIRAWLALLVALQVLHAFPVAGSQVSWGTFLWIPLAAMAAPGAARVVLASFPKVPRGVLTAGSAAVILATTVHSVDYAWGGVTQIRQSDTLRLPGAASLRLPENFTTMLRLLARNASAHADVLFSLPGLHSFHLWTDVPPPTTFNATHWFTLLSPAQQEAIREKLAASPRSCVIVQRNIYDFLRANGIATESPLAVWLHANYEPAFTIETYEFWVRKGRRIAPLNTVRAREASGAATPRYQFTFVFAEPELRDVTSIELARFAADTSTPIQTWTRDSAQLFVTPINSTGADAGPGRPVTFPWTARGLIRLELRTDQVPAAWPQDAVFYLRNAAGETLAEARLIL